MSTETVRPIKFELSAYRYVARGGVDKAGVDIRPPLDRDPALIKAFEELDNDRRDTRRCSVHPLSPQDVEQKEGSRVSFRKLGTESPEALLNLSAAIIEAAGHSVVLACVPFPAGLTVEDMQAAAEYDAHQAEAARAQARQRNY